MSERVSEITPAVRVILIQGQKAQLTRRLDYLYAARPINNMNSFQEVNKHGVENYSLISAICYQESSHSITLQCGLRLHCSSRRIILKKLPKIQVIWPRVLLQ